MFNFTQKLKKRPGLWPYLFEFFTVLLSVYLAFLITEWREDYKIKKEVNVAKERLDQEILDNYKQLIDFHKDVSRRYEKLLEVEAMLTPGKPFKNYVSHFNGYVIPTFKKVAWKRVINSHLVHLISTEYMDKVNEIYWRYETLEDMPKQNNEVFIGENVFDVERAKIAYDISRLFVWQQRQWAKVYLNNNYDFIKKNSELLDRLQTTDSLSYQYYLKQDSLIIAREKEKTQKDRLPLTENKQKKSGIK